MHFELWVWAVWFGRELMWISGLNSNKLPLIGNYGDNIFTWSDYSYSLRQLIWYDMIWHEFIRKSCVYECGWHTPSANSLISLCGCCCRSDTMRQPLDCPIKWTPQLSTVANYKNSIKWVCAKAIKWSFYRAISPSALVKLEEKRKRLISVIKRRECKRTSPLKHMQKNAWISGCVSLRLNAIAGLLCCPSMWRNFVHFRCMF